MMTRVFLVSDQLGEITGTFSCVMVFTELDDPKVKKKLKRTAEYQFTNCLCLK